MSSELKDICKKLVAAKSKQRVREILMTVTLQVRSYFALLASGADKAVRAQRARPPPALGTDN